MDDMILFERNKDQAVFLKDEIEKFIKALDLKLNEKSCIKRIDQQFEFLKVIFILKETGKIKHKIARKSFNTEIKKLKALCIKFKENKLSYRKLLEHTNSYFGITRGRASKHQLKVLRRIVAQNTN